MPTIIVISNESTGQGSSVVLSEDIQPEQLASEHHAAQLIERVGWAVHDADAAEDAPGGRRNSIVTHAGRKPRRA